MKTLILALALLFTIQLSGQDPIMQKDHDALENVATKITKAYDDQIGLDGSQFVPFQKIVEEYLIREETIHKNFKGRQKLDLLYNLRKAESMEIRNVLTQPQFNLYKTIKPQIQPLAKINSKKDISDDTDK
ncbi:hypothetical protein [Winogradskyella luteola]|uniref:Uncharacterized protein n=1 Tax=Winogradskyella luteola TaxID=2828330 RepID=A0A9X1F664_9FLAO|nr:hypothetical protein [Winogradskyella luteola]MBV7268110.1 hypothetical protein [Winogradskyella luteola]